MNKYFRLYRFASPKSSDSLSVEKSSLDTALPYIHHRAEEAIDVYKEMLQFGPYPNSHTYTILMEFLMDSGKYEEALEILYKMQEAGVHPDKAASNILIQKCSKAGQAHIIPKILEYMKENHLALRHPVLLEAFETLKSFSQGNSLLRQVNPHISTEYFSKEMEVSLTTNTPATPFILDSGLMSILLRKENLIAVDCLLVGLIDVGVKLDSLLISTVHDANCSRDGPDGVLLAFEYCLKKGVILQRHGYLNVIGILLRSNLFSKVLKVVQEMVRGGYSLEVYFAAVLIYNLGKARRTSCAVEVFNLLLDEQMCSPTYTAPISAYFCAGSVDKGLQIWRTMEEIGIAPSLGSNALIQADLQKSKGVSETEIYRKEINNFQIDYQSQALIPTSEKLCDLLFGGLDNASTSSFYVLKTDRLWWKELNVKREQLCAWNSHSMVACWSFICMFAGYNVEKTLTDLYSFEVQTCLWKQVKIFGRSSHARFAHSLFVYGHFLRVFGDCHVGHNFHELALLDLRLCIWKHVSLHSDGKYSFVRRTHIVVGDELVIFGSGASCYAFGAKFNEPVKVHLDEDLDLNVRTDSVDLNKIDPNSAAHWAIQLKKIHAKLVDILKIYGWLDLSRKVHSRERRVFMCYPVTLEHSVDLLFTAFEYYLLPSSYPPVLTHHPK